MPARLGDPERRRPKSPAEQLFAAIEAFVDARVDARVEEVRTASLDPRIDVRDVTPRSLRRRLRAAAERGELGEKVEKIGQSLYVPREAVEAWLAQRRLALGRARPSEDTSGEDTASDLDEAFGARRAAGARP